MANQEIRMIARESKVFLWRVAEKLGVSEPTLTRKLRYELPEEEKQRILSIIRELVRAS
jgi:hypothetical protein